MSRARGRAAAPALSILIPTLNEAAALPALLEDLRAQQGPAFELLVADGGSRDLTIAIACRYGAKVVSAARGRAAQLNAAAAQAQAAWLLCLHADTRFTAPDQLACALRLLRTAQRAGGVVAGHWPLQFLRCQPGYERLFRQLEAKSASNRPGTVNGDQGLLIHRKTLTALGGFDASLPFFEDQRLARKIFAEGRFLQLPGVLQTSARRFETEGHRERLLLMALIVGAEHAGLQDWLAALPALYREQAAASRLHPAAFIASLLAHIEALPPSHRRRVWRHASQLITQNTWQLALWADTLRGAPRWLPRFDALAAPPLAQRALQEATARALPWLLRAMASR